ncbi:MAG: adenylate kinase family protein [Methanophagales archaeon]|nr:adenylate kinase family protein [Methanophagales archaeon]
MIIFAITGTPGTGKTSVCKSKALGLEFMDLNKVIEEKGFYTGVDNERGCFIADLDKLKEYVKEEKEEKRGQKKGGNLLMVIESHLAHFLEPDVAIVLRANPLLLADRLKKRGFSVQKIRENVEAEMLDVILAEAVELCGIVYEVDTSGKSIEEAAFTVREIIDAEIEGESGKKEALREKYKPGSVDWTRHLTVTMKSVKCKVQSAKETIIYS